MAEWKCGLCGGNSMSFNFNLMTKKFTIKCDGCGAKTQAFDKVADALDSLSKMGNVSQEHKMINGDRIRGMSNEQLAKFLYMWQVNAVTSFLQYGGMEMYDFIQMKKWIEGTEKNPLEKEMEE